MFLRSSLSYVSPTSQSTCPVFCIQLKKLGYLCCRVSYGLDFVDHIFMGLFIIFLIPYLSWKLILRSRGMIIVRFKFCEEYFIVFCEYIGLEVYGVWLSLFCIMLAAIDNCYYYFIIFSSSHWAVKNICCLNVGKVPHNVSWFETTWSKHFKPVDYNSSKLLITAKISRQSI